MKSSTLSRSTKPLKRSSLRAKPDAAKMTSLGKQLSVKPRNLKCAICKKPFLTFSSFVKWCSPDCGAELALQKLEKARLKFAKESRAATRIAKEALKTKSEHARETQVWVNRLARERDHGQGCISCGTHNGKQNAGHFLSVGAHPNHRYNLLNIHLQCERCNTYLSGNISAYRPRLIAKIGLEAVEALEADTEPKHYSIDDLKAIKADAKAKLKALQATRASHHPE